jgi:hypothetical protein
MKILLVLLVHLLTTIAKLLGPGGAKVHIPAQGEQSFWFNVNTDSGRM